MKPFNVNAAAAYARRRGRRMQDLSPEECALFETKDGGFAHDNPETRAWSSIHPKHGERFHGWMTPCVYIVQSAKPLYEHVDGRKERRAYGIFFDIRDAEEYIDAMGLESDETDIICCPKIDFRKSIWGWDVDGL